MRRIQFAILVVALAGLPVAHAWAATGQTQHRPDVEGGILTELNAVRVANGLKPLKLSPGLQAAAVAHSRAMLERGFFNHSSPEGGTFSGRLQRFYPSRGFGRWTVGENILYHSAELAAPDAIMAWMNSPPHRRNLLDPAWREVGVGALWAPVAPGQFGGGQASVVTLDFGARTGRARAR